MLSHIERKVLTVCFHLNRKGILSVQEICYRTKKQPEEVKRILQRLHELGYLTRNKKGQVEVYVDFIKDDNKPEPVKQQKKHHVWYE